MKSLVRVVGLVLLVVLSFPNDPASYLRADESPLAHVTLAQLTRASAPPLVAIVGLALCISLASMRAARLRAGLGALVREVPATGREDAAATLRLFARALYGSAWIASLLAAVSAFLLLGRVAGDAHPDALPSPAFVARLLTWAILAPSLGIASARLWIAPTADALAARAGSDRRTFRPQEELGFLVLIVPVVLTWLVVFTPAEKL